MKITRIIALAIIAGASGAAGIQAQTLREASPPAEYPPLSFKGKQYVDSRGCIYIRAGIDGNVAWVPRVNRARKQLCGYAPTKLAGATKQQPLAAAPELITIEPSQQPAQPAAAKPAAAPPAGAAASAPPKAVTAAKPVRAPQAAAVAAVPAAPKPEARQAGRVTPKPAPAPAAAAEKPAGSNACAGLSDISRKYTNSSGVRCGPQEEPPVSYGGPQSSVRLTPNTRVVQTHIYQDRRLSNSFPVPKGYRPVWTDGRLNPQRAVRTVRPAVVTSFAQAPAGYEVVEREDGRMNPLRGVRTPDGDAQMAQIWTNGVPRNLVQPPLDRPAVTLPREARVSPAEAQPKGLRLSTRSAPGAAVPERPATAQRFVRAATYADAGQAKAAARRLAATGLTVRLGTVSRKGQPYKVVLAGPYQGEAQAAAALSKVQRAGFSGARLSK